MPKKTPPPVTKRSPKTILTLSVTIFCILIALSWEQVHKSKPEKNIDRFIFPTSAEQSYYEDAAETLSDELARYTQQFTIINDTNHNNLALLDFLSADDTMKTFKKHGYKNLFLEIRHDFQPFADKVVSGEWTPEDFATAKNEAYLKVGSSAKIPRAIAEGRLIQSAGKHGINVICIESQLKDLKAHNASVQYLRDIEVLYFQTKNKLLTQYLLTHPLILSKMIWQKLVHKKKEDDMVQFRTAMSYRLLIEKSTPMTRTIVILRKAVTEKRIANDLRLAHAIQRRAKDEKSLIYYGAAHGRNHCDLDNHLNADAHKAKRIELYANIEDAKFGWQNIESRGNEFSPALVIKGNRLYSTDDARNNVLKGYAIPAAQKVELCNAEKDTQ